MFVNFWLLEGFLFDMSAQSSPLPTGVLSSSGGEVSVAQGGVIVGSSEPREGV